MTITLNGSDLTVTQVVAAARHGHAVALAPEAVAAMRQARAVVQEVLDQGEPVYGLTTGVGERKSFLLEAAERQRFNHRLVLNHRIAQGDAAPADVVRGAMVCLANSYAKGVTGVRPELAEMIVTVLNEGFAPKVRTLGSIGQGDLGPMADLAHGLITRSGFEVAENEGLALVSSNAFTTAWACLAIADAQTLMDTFDVAGALDLEAFGANLTSLHPVIEQTRPFPGLASTLHTLRTLLAGSYLWQPGAARFLQDPLTFRCIPQIHGAARDALAYGRAILQLELNSSQSNPVVVVADRSIVSVGNFDIGPLAAALDFARIAVAPVVTSANERAVKLLQAPFSGLPAGLAAAPATPDDALSELATSGQAITVEARTLAHPVSYELASSVKGDGIEDRATMAPLSARRLAEMIALAARVAAIELVVAAQAVDLRAHSGCGPLGLGTGRAYRMVRELVPFTQADGTLPADLEPVVELITRGDLNPPDPGRLTCLDSRLPCPGAARGNRRELRRRRRRGRPHQHGARRPRRPLARVGQACPVAHPHSTLITRIGELVTNDSVSLASSGPRAASSSPDAWGGPGFAATTDAALVIEDGTVAWAGPAARAPAADSIIDAGGRAVLPGFVDSHAHLVFAGERSAEFAARMAGLPYQAGGILTTVAATRAATDVVLRANLRRLAAEMLRQGTTTFECKSGYGLTVADEKRGLMLAAEVTPEVTFLGAHVVPPEFAGDVTGYVELVCGPMLDACAPHARWVDVFCEDGAFGADEAAAVLAAGRAAGLVPRVHANQLGPGPGVRVAAEAGAASADHCTFLSDADIDVLTSTPVVATLLPGAEFGTRQPFPDARRLLDTGATVALATDCNPGSSFTSSMPFCIALAVRDMRMTTREAVWAATAGGAAALRRTDVGHLGVGARADLILLDAPSHAYLAYRPGVPQIAAVWQAGRLAAGSPSSSP